MTPQKSHPQLLTISLKIGATLFGEIMRFDPASDDFKAAVRRDFEKMFEADDS